MILITGGLGFIGSHVTGALLDLGESCVLVQRRTSGPSGLIAPDDGTRLLVDRSDASDVGALRQIGGAWGPLGRPASMFIAAPQMVHAAVHGRPLGQPVHAADGGDLVYVRDCGREIALLQLADRLSYRTYNVSSGRVTTNAELAA